MQQLWTEMKQLFRSALKIVEKLWAWMLVKLMEVDMMEVEKQPSLLLGGQWVLCCCAGLGLVFVSRLQGKGTEHEY